jgi:2-oxoisovalerate dehydrogenase E1 component alpha subunit
MREFSKAEKEKKPALDHMWGDVYGGSELERPIREQRSELKRLIMKYGETKGWKKQLEVFEGGKEAVSKW